MHCAFEINMTFGMCAFVCVCVCVCVCVHEFIWGFRYMYESNLRLVTCLHGFIQRVSTQKSGTRIIFSGIERRHGITPICFYRAQHSDSPRFHVPSRANTVSIGSQDSTFDLARTWIQIYTGFHVILL